MKIKLIKLAACMAVLLFLIVSKGMSQNAQQSISSANAQQQLVKGGQNGMYTYALFLAPNKVYGYNIFLDGRIIFHQPAMAQQTNQQLSIIKKAQADKAATIAIEKIKRGMPGELSPQEIMQATAQQQTINQNN